MITQQQALEALEALKHAGPDGWGPIEHFTTLRQYIEQGAQPGVDVVMVPRKPNAVQVAAGNRVTWPFPCEQVYRVMIDAFAAAPQPQQEQSK